MAPKKKKRRSTRTTRKTTPRRKTTRRSQKDQERLVRELLSVFFFTFGLVSLVVMYKTESEAGFGLHQFLLTLSGLGSWFVSVACFYIGFVLLFPSKLWQRLSSIIWTLAIVIAVLGLLELPLVDQDFSSDLTRGGIIGYSLDRILTALMGKFLAGFVQIVLILTSLLLLTRISLTQATQHLLKAARLIGKTAQALWYEIEDTLFAPKQENKSKHDGYPILDSTDEAQKHAADPEQAEDLEIYRDFAFQEQRILSPEPGSAAGDATQNEPELASKPKPNKPSVWFLPHLGLLDKPATNQISQGDPGKRRIIIENTLDSFGVDAKVVEINEGPTITQYAIEPAVGVKVSKITALQNDLALALATPRIRIESPIPGKPYIGIEVPNYAAATVTLRGMLESSQFQQSKYTIPLAFGLNVSGDVFFADLVKMPHMLIAGATGSGKSVCINSIIGSILFKFNPDQVKFIMVDPKVVELSGYNGIPHLLTKVITKPEKMLSSLKWAINEMERRYQVFAQEKARNIESYNQMQDDVTRLPYIIIIVDELADLMLAAPAEVEESICRLAQKARATGIHLVIATQRPSVDVVTGLIKANIPSRVCFAVASQTDSRVVLDANGAEKLLGRGDMLYQAPNLGKMTRLQGVFVSDQEVDKLVKFWSEQGDPDFLEEVTSQPIDLSPAASLDEMDDDLLPQAFQEILREDKGSASLLQRRLRIGYARAARIIDILEQQGVLGPADGSKPREILRRSLRTNTGNNTVIDASESLFDDYE